LPLERPTGASLRQPSACGVFRKRLSDTATLDEDPLFCSRGVHLRFERRPVSRSARASAGCRACPRVGRFVGRRDENRLSDFGWRSGRSAYEPHGARAWGADHAIWGISSCAPAAMGSIKTLRNIAAMTRFGGAMAFIKHATFSPIVLTRSNTLSHAAARLRSLALARISAAAVISFGSLPGLSSSGALEIVKCAGCNDAQRRRSTRREPLDSRGRASPQAGNFSLRSIS
jgi:hypothetical protein